jgi:hypothetical protein
MFTLVILCGKQIFLQEAIERYLKDNQQQKQQQSTIQLSEEFQLQLEEDNNVCVLKSFFFMMCDLVH